MSDENALHLEHYLQNIFYLKHSMKYFQVDAMSAQVSFSIKVRESTKLKQKLFTKVMREPSEGDWV
jgi:hypothetical protein